MTRLIRFLTTLRRSTFFDTAKPNREQSLSFLRANTLKYRSEETIDFLKTFLNSEGLLIQAQ